MDEVSLPAGRQARGSVRAPGSKSHAIRCLVTAALAPGTSELSGFPRGDDTRAALDALRALGFAVDVRGDAVLVEGAGGAIPADRAGLHVGGSGTALRFFAALGALGPGPYTLDGDESLRARPAGSIVDALRALGCEVATSGTPPVTVSGGPATGGVTVPVDGSLSSQPVSAMLLCAPALSGGLTVAVTGDGVSAGYVDLTVRTMHAFGVEVESAGDARRLSVSGGGYRPARTSVEGDWSSASFLLAAGAATGGDVTVEGLDPGSAQPDRAIAGLLRAFGATVEETAGSVRASGPLRSGADVDLGAAPDLAPLAGALGCVAPGVTVVRGAPHLRLKETDRIGAVVAAARALGCDAEERPDGFEVRGGAAAPGVVDPRGDHRVAMAFAVAGLGIGGVRVTDPGCVAKSYPGFWDVLESLAGPFLRA